MPVRTYDPKRVKVIFGGAILGGFADGTAVVVAKNSDAFTTVNGNDGVTSRAKSNDKSGTIVLTLAQTSPSNRILMAAAKKDEISNDGISPVAVKDLSGDSTYASGFAWVRKIPDSEYAKEITNREWTLDCADLTMFVGGNDNFE